MESQEEKDPLPDLKQIMELEIEDEQIPVTVPKKSSSWRIYLESPAATRMVYLIFGLVAIAMVMGFLQFQTSAVCCGDWDGYYHIRWSQLLWESLSGGNWLPSFDWLPLTVLNPADYNDHHFLFHLLQIPFLWFLEPVMAAKVGAVFFATLAIFSVYWMIYYYKVEHQLLWLGGILTCGNMFFYRMNMAKAPPLTIIMTVLGIYLLFQRKYIWLLPLMFAFVWTYSLFPLLWIAALIWVMIIAWNERKFEWQPLAYTTGGMVLGNIINPYFPSNLVLFAEHFITKFKVGSDFAVAVGGEWYPYNGMELLTHFPIALIAMLIGYILFMPRNGKLPEKATFFLVFVTILLAAQFRSKRFAEYFPPFAILFAAFSYQAFTAKKDALLPDEFRRDIEPYLDAARSVYQRRIDMLRMAAQWSIGVIIFITLMVNMVGLHSLGISYGGVMSSIKNNEKNDYYRRSMEWATGETNGVENIPAGERIFNANWDDFPKLFFHNTKHSYVYGLDPNYLYSENPELYKTLLEITSGRMNEAGPVIREKFGANWVFADAKENVDMVAKLLDSGWAEIVYEDDEARLLRIREVKGISQSIDEAPETPEEKAELDRLEREANSNSNILDEEDEDDATTSNEAEN